MMNKRYQLNIELNHIVDTEGIYHLPSTYLSFNDDKLKIVDLLNKKDNEIKKKDKLINELLLTINGLEYALANIKSIDVEIDLNEENS